MDNNVYLVTGDDDILIETLGIYGPIKEPMKVSLTDAAQVAYEGNHNVFVSNNNNTFVPLNKEDVKEVFENGEKTLGGLKEEIDMEIEIKEEEETLSSIDDEDLGDDDLTGFTIDDEDSNEDDEDDSTIEDEESDDEEDNG